VHVSPSTHGPLNESLSRKDRIKQLNSIKNLQIQGAIAIKMQDQAQSAYFNWQKKSNGCYQLILFGPLGMQSVHIQGCPGSVTLTNTQHQIFKARTPEGLILEQTGLFLPVSNLNDWILGLAIPNKKAKQTLDSYNHLIKLEQNGFLINYLQYTQHNGIDLPSKLLIKDETLTLKIIINQWKF